MDSYQPSPSPQQQHAGGSNSGVQTVSAMEVQQLKAELQKQQAYIAVKNDEIVSLSQQLAQAGAELTTVNLPCENGYANDKGGCIQNLGTLTQYSSPVSSCTGNFIEGGCIYNFGTMTTYNSSVTSCKAPFGGCIHNDNMGKLTMHHSPISDCQHVDYDYGYGGCINVSSTDRK